MPILTINLVHDQYSEGQIESLLVQCSEKFAEGLRCPIDRVRVFINELPADRVCVGGKLVKDTNAKAPYFSFIVLEGRSVEDKQFLLKAFTDLIVNILGAPREMVRGGVVPVLPSDWCIGGEFAAQARLSEIEARAKQQSTSSPQ